MSVWPEKAPADTALSGREGQLVSISIAVEARQLESLLEALAQIRFPINPQIYHDAAMVYSYPDRREKSEPVTLVEFPAYAARLVEVRRAIQSYGFEADAVQVTSMLDEIHEECPDEPAPSGAPYVSRHRVKHRTAAATIQ